jgi:hypothetical protein
MTRAGLPLAEVEATVLEAERLADELEALGSDAAAEAPLFTRALRTMARNLRLALIAPPEEVVLLKMVLGLETTIRRVSSRNLAPGGDPPPSQRATLPPPPGLSAEELWERLPPSDRGPETARCPVPKDSEIRFKVEAKNLKSGSCVRASRARKGS